MDTKPIRELIEAAKRLCARFEKSIVHGGTDQEFAVLSTGIERQAITAAEAALAEDDYDHAQS